MVCKMGNFLCVILMIALLPVLGCVETLEKELVPPDPIVKKRYDIPDNSNTSHKISNVLNRYFKNGLSPSTEMLFNSGKIIITRKGSNNNSEFGLRVIVGNCLDFLKDYLGPPLFNGRLEIIIASKFDYNGQMIWKQSDSTYRKIIINSLNLYRDETDTLWHIIVHELTHGLYQSPSMIKNSTEFIIEAQAAYMQHLSKQVFRHGKADPKKVYPSLESTYKSIHCTGFIVDLDKKFASYGQCTNDQLYRLGALLFLSQDSSFKSHSLYHKIMSHPPSIKMDTQAWVNHYDLKINDLFKGMLVQNTENSIPQMSKNKIKIYQSILKKKGFYQGTIDGLWGPVSKEALQKFQKTIGLPVTGRLDKATVKELKD